MCKWGTSEILHIRIDSSLSHTGRAYWRDVGIDACIAPIVKALQDAGIDMLASCCGHGKTQGRIDLADGRVLLVRKDEPESESGCEHGTAWDVHCCNCHSGFLFDPESCVCGFDDDDGGESVRAA